MSKAHGDNVTWTAGALGVALLTALGCTGPAPLQVEQPAQPTEPMPAQANGPGEDRDKPEIPLVGDTGRTPADSENCEARVLRFRRRMNSLDHHPSRFWFGGDLAQLPLVRGAPPPDSLGMALTLLDGAASLDGTPVGSIDSPDQAAVTAWIETRQANWRVLHPNEPFPLTRLQIVTSDTTALRTLTAWAALFPQGMPIELIVRSAEWRPAPAAPRTARPRVHQIEEELSMMSTVGRLPALGGYSQAARGDCPEFDEVLASTSSADREVRIRGTFPEIAGRCGCDVVDVDLLEMLLVFVLRPAGPPVGAITVRPDGTGIWSPASTATVADLLNGLAN